MIGLRTRYSFAQFLELQPPAVIAVLFSKYAVQHYSLPYDNLLPALVNILRSLDERTTMHVLTEVIATAGDLRARVNPKYRFDERMHDLTQCLLLDGYIVTNKTLIKGDPSISNAPPIEDDLIFALQNSDAPRKEEIIARINDSAAAFRATPPDFNASLTNARVALETLAVDIAALVATRMEKPTPYDPSKWGMVIQFLRTSNEITIEEEKGLTGVYGFLSAGAHRPVGIPEDQMARLGRSFALNMCWFMLKNHSA